ncbi:MAG TPA: AbrB/MazE/SpoVT family DNA-binding domain-containing protein [Acidimicrobiales bacterium]|jgi:AbrB family looped-hinge helix DNA binding protein
MEAAAKITSKGQITIPKVIRDALELHEGDTVVFRIDGKRAIVAPAKSLLDLAGSVSVPAAKRGTPWDEVRTTAWTRRASQLHEQGHSSTPTS